MSAAKKLPRKGESVTLWLQPTGDYPAGRQLHGVLVDVSSETYAVRHGSGRIGLYARRLVRSLVGCPGADRRSAQPSPASIGR